MCISIKNALILWSNCVETTLFSPSFDFLHVHMHPHECRFHLHVAFSLTYSISLACIFYTCYIADSSVDPIFLTKTFVTLHSFLTCSPPHNPTYNQVFPRAHVFSENRRDSDQYFNVSVPSPLPGPRLRVEGSAINMTMTAGTFSVYIRFTQMWHRHAHTHTHTSTSTNTNTYTYTHIQTHKCTHAHTLEDTLTHIYIHTCIHIHVYIRLSCEDIEMC